jgi:hypothetical protein
LKTLDGNAVGNADLGTANLMPTRPRSSAIDCRARAGDADSG